MKHVQASDPVLPLHSLTPSDSVFPSALQASIFVMLGCGRLAGEHDLLILSLHSLEKTFNDIIL